MGRKRRREAVTVSFHYLARQYDDGSEVPKETPISEADFAALSSKLQALPELDLAGDKIQKILLFTNYVPIENVEAIDEQTLFGVYWGVYSGHAYENTEKGKISATSMNLRPFYFVLYRAIGGRLYLGVQYLGHYGSYMDLRDTITSMLPNKKNIIARSFRLDSNTFKNIEPKEVRVKISRKPTKISSGNVFEEGAIVAFKKTNRDDEFGEIVKSRLLPFMGTTKEKVQKAVSSILNDSKLLDVEDSQIEDCTIIGDVDGLRKTIYMIEQGIYATQFPINPSFNGDGHPEYEPTKKAMLETLQNKIVLVKENV